jgi:hypothetical protein
MTILWQGEIPRFQERSVELQIPPRHAPRRAGAGGMTKFMEGGCWTQGVFHYFESS